MAAMYCHHLFSVLWRGKAPDPRSAPMIYSKRERVIERERERESERERERECCTVV